MAEIPAPTNTPPPTSGPESISLGMHDAAAMLDSLENKEESNAQPKRPERADAGDNAGPDPAPEEGDEGEAPDEGEGGDEGEGEVEETETGEDETLNTAPSFWSAEDKAAWASVPPALRPILKKYEQAQIDYAKSKEHEAAKVRQEAIEYAKQATGVVEEAAKWWQANGPQFFRTFGDRWATVDWNALAEQNPAEWARLKQQREVEADMLQQAHARGQRDIETATQQANARLQEAKRSEHEKLAAKLPEYFGPTKAAKTYDDLGKFLYAQGIDADRINAIHEAPIIELALDAMRYRAAKKQSTGVGNGPATNPAQRTPLRVAPGPAARADNQGNERMRRAREQVRKGNSVSTETAAALMNSLKL